MAEKTVAALRTGANDLGTIEDLGVHIQRLAAAAAINCGAGDGADEAWLVDLAYDEVQAAKERYLRWAGPRVEEVR